MFFKFKYKSRNQKFWKKTNSFVLFCGKSIKYWNFTDILNIKRRDNFMAKSTDVLDNVMDQMTDLNRKMTDFSSHLMSMVENYDVLMQNQSKVVDNHDIVIDNQKAIIKNQGIITHNQSSIIHNQSVIVKNQSYLKTILFTQTEILTLLTQRPKEEIAEEIKLYFEKAQSEIASGFENPIGE